MTHSLSKSIRNLRRLKPELAPDFQNLLEVWEGMAKDLECQIENIQNEKNYTTITVGFEPFLATVDGKLVNHHEALENQPPEKAVR